MAPMLPPTRSVYRAGMPPPLMKTRRGSPGTGYHRVALLLLTVACGVTSTAPRVALAQASPIPAEVQRWALDPATPEEIDERIQGQTADLRWTRVSAGAAGAERPADRSGSWALSRARALVTPAAPARVVVRVVEDPGSNALVVTIVDIPQARVLEREVALGADRSAALEAAALIVRGALQTLADGGEIGVRAPERVGVMRTSDPEPTGVDRVPGSAATHEDDQDGSGDSSPGDPTQHARGVSLGIGLFGVPIVEWDVALGFSADVTLRLGGLLLGAEVGGTLRRGTGSEELAQLRVGSFAAALRAGYLGRRMRGTGGLSSEA